MQVKSSQRLTFRLMDENDADELFELDQDPDVMKYINGGQMTSRQDIVEKFVPRVKRFTDPEKGWGLWRVAVTESDTFIGWILLRPMAFFTDNPQRDNLEIGWRFMQNSWGQGYATEAANAVVDMVKTSPDVTRLSAIADEGNLASIGIMKKLAMVYVQTKLYDGPHGQVPVVVYETQL